jgi:hypothetical protein
MSNPREDARRREAEAALAAVRRDAEQIGASTLARTANQVRDHFSATDTDPTDTAEVWGKRIARVLAMIAVAVLVWVLVTTYLM